MTPTATRTCSTGAPGPTTTGSTVWIRPEWPPHIDTSPEQLIAEEEPEAFDEQVIRPQDRADEEVEPEEAPEDAAAKRASVEDRDLVVST